MPNDDDHLHCPARAGGGRSRLSSVVDRGHYRFSGG
jgi:hypothetical protein